MLTNFSGSFSDDGIDGIIEGFQDSIELVVISEGFEKENLRAILDEDDSALMDSKVDGKIPKTKSQLLAESCIIKLMKSGVSGDCYSFEHASKAVVGFEKKTVKPAAWKCNLRISKHLAIPCVAYAKTKLCKAQQSWKKCHAQTHKTTDIERRTSYFIDNDGIETEAEKEDIGKAYKYGSDLIPYSKDDELQSKYVTDEKKLDVLAFTKSSNVPKHLCMDDQAHVVMGSDAVARLALSTLAEAMATSDVEMCAVACYVYRKGSMPKVVVLYPRVKMDYALLVMVPLPFSEDMRPLRLPSLNKVEVSLEQSEAVDQLIDQMSLMPGNNGGEELFAPKQTINPYFQRTFQCLSHLMQNSGAELPAVSEHIRKLLQPDPIVADRCKSAVDKVKKLFPVGKDGAKKEEKTNELWKNAELCKGAGDATSKEIAKPRSIIDSSVVTKVGTNTPKNDFVFLLQEAKKSGSTSTEEIFSQLIVRIKELVEDVLVMKHSFKITECLKEMCREAVLNNHVSKVNEFFLDLKRDLTGRNKNDVWKSLFVDAGIGLISRIVSAEGASGEACSKFLSLDTNQAAYDDFEDDNEADDLIMMID